MNDEFTKWVDDEKRLDRKVRRISYGAWVATVIAVVAYGVMVIAQTAFRLHYATVTGGTHGVWEAIVFVLQQLTPLFVVLGVLSLLVAVLSTVGMLVRFRTASLAEIQTRLAAMEGMLSHDPPER